MNPQMPCFDKLSTGQQPPISSGEHRHRSERKPLRLRWMPHFDLRICIPALRGSRRDALLSARSAGR